VDCFMATHLSAWFIKLVPAFPVAVETLVAWADHATGGLYGELRRRRDAYARFYPSPYGQEATTFELANPTDNSFLFGLMRDRVVKVELIGKMPPPAPLSHLGLPAPPVWLERKEAVAWVRTVLKAVDDEARMRTLLARVIDRTGLRPWTVLAAFSPAYAGWYGHRFRPTVELWRCMPEADIAFVERTTADLVLHSQHPPVRGQTVGVARVRK
jgi:hypothetical protein